MKHQKVIKRNTDIEQSKVMYKYAQLKMFHHDRRLQVYMYAFMYIDLETSPVEGHFTYTKTIIVNYKKMLTSGPVPKHCLGFSHIVSKYYGLDQNFDDTEF